MDEFWLTLISRVWNSLQGDTTTEEKDIKSENAFFKLKIATWGI
jgi:hypothetical protein